MPPWSPSASTAAKIARATEGKVRVLGEQDTPALRRLLDQDPSANVTVAGLLANRGTAAAGRGRQGAMILGVDQHSAVPGGPGAGAQPELAAACWMGSNIIPVGADSQQGARFGVAAAALRRRVSSIYGRAEGVLALHRATGWVNHREVRPVQPLLVLDRPSAVEPMSQVRPSRLTELTEVERACAAMFTEELGFSPYQHGGSQYRDRIRTLIRSGLSLISVDPSSGDIIFKAEFGAVTHQVAQVQGVWVHPRWRGRGLAAPGMSAVVDYGLELAPVVSLYVNSWNTPALSTYKRVGFTRDGTYATVLY